jgi:hypothetical protein
MKARSVRRIIGTVLGLIVSLVLLVHLTLLVFTDWTREYHGFGIWVVIGVLATVAGLLLLGKDDAK